MPFAVALTGAAVELLFKRKHKWMSMKPCRWAPVWFSIIRFMPVCGLVTVFLGPARANPATPQPWAGSQVPISFKVTGLAVDTNQNVFIADADHATVYKMTSEGQLVKLSEAFSNLDVIGNCLALDRAGNCFVLDRDEVFAQSKIHKISPAGAVEAILTEPRTNQFAFGGFIASGLQYHSIGLISADEICLAFRPWVNGPIYGSSRSGVYKIKLPGRVRTLLNISQNGEIRAHLIGVPWQRRLVIVPHE